MGASKVGYNALAFPITIAGRFQALGTADFLDRLGWFLVRRFFDRLVPGRLGPGCHHFCPPVLQISELEGTSLHELAPVIGIY